MNFSNLTRLKYVVAGILALTLLTGCPPVMIARAVSKANKNEAPAASSSQTQTTEVQKPAANP